MPRPLFYTFGNHMHWVDMQWLWGYHVLPGCIDDMLELIRRTGARGNVNFDAVGYERLAAEAPEALARLRQAVADGDAEPVGCTYGQPYGLFQGCESNIRQFTFGVRATRRLLGVRPRTFWEEEFCFFPQLPQILTQTGYTGACLFFQWTWHTPELPRERSPLIRWRGVDGAELPALPRNDLNVHQWPEDFDGLLEQGLVNELEHPAVVQWLELMPSRDWMCRSEVLLPRLQELFADPRFDVRPRTCAQLIDELLRTDGSGTSDAIPERCYSPDDIWHGMTLGKNADRHPRTSRRVENEITRAEAVATLASLLGRPYPSWDVYPTWELDEAWRECLAAQHHDNHECEGLCGFIGFQQFDKASAAASEVYARSIGQLEDRAQRRLVFNRLGWTVRKRHIAENDRGEPVLVEIRIPPFGYAPEEHAPIAAETGKATRRGSVVTFQRGAFSAKLDLSSGRVTSLKLGAREFVGGDGIFVLRARVGGKDWNPSVVDSRFLEEAATAVLELGDDAGGLPVMVALSSDRDALIVAIPDLAALPRPDPGLNAAHRIAFNVGFGVHEVRADMPGSVHGVQGSITGKRKYPEGDWMTSPQWFEDVRGSIVGATFFDLVDADGSGVLITHDGSQQAFRTQRGIEVVLNAYDPWDESRYDVPSPSPALFVIEPHGPMRDSDRVRRGMETGTFGEIPPPDEDEPFEPNGLAVGGGGRPEKHPVPAALGGLEVLGAPGVLAVAMHRSNPKDGEHIPEWAGHEMARRSDGACTHPVAVRLIEWDGEAAEVTLKLPGPIAAAAKTNLLGEVGPGVGGGADTGWLEPEPAEPPAWWDPSVNPTGIEWQQVRFRMRPREIATVMADLVPGRKQFRDLDAKREVWATIHKASEGSGA